MYDILHRIGIAAPRARVYDALTTLDGLAGWWTRDVSGDPDAGGKVTFLFGGPDRSVVVEVTEATPDTHVAWRCVGGPD
ncbi:MAG: SRPBCC family protein, partial [Acidimicrobiales bacterium]